MSDEVWAAGLALSGLAILAAAGLAFRAWRFVAGGARAAGRITRIEREVVESPAYGGDRPAESTEYFRPHVEFADAGGARIAFRSRVAHPRSPLYREGETVTVVYASADPSSTAEILGPAVWRTAIFAGIGATVVVLVTLIGRACG